MQVIGLFLCHNHDYLTYSGECSCTQKKEVLKFAIVGTDYGWLHTTSGDPRFWGSRSGARAKLKRFKEAHGL
ncbi:hypothetical protein Lumi_110 [Xylophilus phage Lumi]|nr:hypothetical protein Lumi_110 [Xylophilus phage Lumi]